MREVVAGVQVLACVRPHERAQVVAGIRLELDFEVVERFTKPCLVYLDQVGSARGVADSTSQMTGYRLLANVAPTDKRVHHGQAKFRKTERGWKPITGYPDFHYDDVPTVYLPHK